jgi:hypothetical protein
VIPGYTVTRTLGEGTFAVVYAGRKAGLDRDVAIKVLKAQAGADVRTGMANELEATVRLTTHPNIVDVLDAGTTSDGDPYMVMGLERQTLADRLVDYACLPWLEAVGIGVKISGALQTAHSAGLLHRDIKPQNILVSEFGEPKLADFGVAQALATAGGPPQGRVFTPYSAPEVLSEGRHSEVSDVYSLAATIHSLIAGTPPFGYGGSDGGDLALAAAISNDPVPDLSQKPFSVPEPVADVLRQAMDRDPAQRPQTALELGTELVAAARRWGERIPDPVVVREATQPADGSSRSGRVVERTGRPSARRRKGGMLRRLFIRARWWTVRHHRGLLAMIAGLAAAGVLGGVLIHLARQGPPRWIPRAPMPTARSWLGTAIGDGRIYAVGGLGSDGRALATVETYDLRSDTWTAGRDLQAARWGAAVTTAGDGRLYAIGGIANGQVLDSVEVARPGGAWTSVRRLPSPRWAAAAVGDRDGRIYVLGGFATTDSHHAVAAIDVYTPATNAWSQAGLMPSPRGAMAAVATPNGDIYALGGTDGPEFTNVDIYDPDTDSWRTGPRLPRARSGLGAGIDADGRVYAVGGYADHHAVAEVDVLEPGGSRAWAPSTSLPLPLYAPVATTPNGRIFVVGGATDTRGLQRMWELVSATGP